MLSGSPSATLLFRIPHPLFPDEIREKWPSGIARATVGKICSSVNPTMRYYSSICVSAAELEPDP